MIKTKLRNLVFSKKGKKPASVIEEPKNGFFPYILIDQMEGKPVKYYTNDNCPKATKEDILLVWDGSIGKNATNIEGVIGSTIICITPKDEVIKEYIHFFIQYSKPTILANPKGTGLAHINPDIFWNLEVPLLSKDKQYLLVSEIEKQFSRLNDGLNSLLKIQRNLKSYRASILKAAVEGNLTEEWRKEQENIEPSSILIARILEERKRKFLNENPGKKYKEPEEIESKNYPNIKLPAKWVFSSINQIIEKLFDGPFGSHLTSSDYTKDGVKVIRLENIGEMTFNRSKEAFISPEKYKTLTKNTLSENDIIFSSFVGESIRACLFPKLDHIAINKADCFCLRYNHNFVLKKFLLFSLSSDLTGKQIIKIAHGITRVRINLSQLRSILIPLPPLVEQHKIVEEVEYRLSIIDEFEQTVNAGIKKAESLKQSILKKAFSGELIK